jgi:hypothetical protein
MPLYFLVLIAISFIGSGCDKRNANQQEPAQQLPDPSATPNLTPDPAAIHLIFPTEVSLGDVFKIEIQNDGAIPVIYYMPDRQANCLYITRDNDFTMAASPECDVLAEIIVQPGQRHLVGSWDLQVCRDTDCLTREAADPGEYMFEMSLFTEIKDGEVVFENPIIKTARFEVTA